MNRLSANLKNMNLQQLQQLPELIKVVITRSPAELKVRLGGEVVLRQQQQQQ
jgi:hypothetical protein